jgi:hypothetical protein
MTTSSFDLHDLAAAEFISLPWRHVLTDTEPSAGSKTARSGITHWNAPTPIGQVWVAWRWTIESEGESPTYVRGSGMALSRIDGHAAGPAYDQVIEGLASRLDWTARAVIAIQDDGKGESPAEA